MNRHLCFGEIFILDSRLANFWDRTCPFGFLHVLIDCGAVALKVLKTVYSSKIDFFYPEERFDN